MTYIIHSIIEPQYFYNDTAVTLKYIPVALSVFAQWPPLLTWFNFNPSMDK